MVYNGTIEEDGGATRRPLYGGTIMSTAIDLSRGVDVFRSCKLLRHFEGADALLQARAFAAQRRGCHIRYWGVAATKPSYRITNYKAR